MIFPFGFWKDGAPDVTAPTPILWWKLNDGSGTAIAAANGPAGTTDAAWVTGQSGSGTALDFNGTSHDGHSTSAVSFGGAQVITICGWYFFDDITTVQNIWESDTHWSTSTNGSYLSQLDTGGFVVAMKGTGGTATARIETAAAPATGAWVHIAVVCDNSTPTGAIKIYYDGVMQTTTIDDNDKAGSPAFEDKPIYVGARSGTSLFYNGRIDDVRIYGRELTGTEINAVKNDPQ